MCRARSTVGEDQMPAPDGPHSCTPCEFFRTGCAAPAIVYVFHITLPLAASSDETLPRNLQHSSLASAPLTSSSDETPTYNLPSASVGAPVTCTSGCESRLVFHRTLPVNASTANT